MSMRDDTIDTYLEWGQMLCRKLCMSFHCALSSKEVGKSYFLPFSDLPGEHGSFIVSLYGLRTAI